MNNITKIFLGLFGVIFSGVSVGQTSISYSDEITGTPMYNRPTETCNLLSSTMVGFRDLAISVDTAGEYRIESDQDNFDGFLFVYEAPFDPADPLTRCIAANDDDNGNRNRSVIPAIALMPDTSYIIVTAGFNSNDLGVFTNTISGPGNIGIASTVSMEDTIVAANRFNRAFADCNGLSGNGNNARYSQQVFSVSLNGNYTVASAQNGFDGFVHVYDERFNPIDPLLGCLAGDDDGPEGVGSSQVLDVRLAAGRTYHVVTSGFNEAQEGTFTTTIDGPGGIFLQPGDFTLEAISGLWFDPALDGSGFNIIAQNNGLIITFYGYINGEQRWLISTLINSELRIGQTSSATLLIGDGGQINAPIPGVNLPDFGTLTIQFISCTEAFATIQGVGEFVGVQQSFNLARLFQSVGRQCNP